MNYFINYQGRKVKLFPLGRNTLAQQYKNRVIGASSGMQKDYKKVEDEAILFLIRGAESRCNRNLSKIILLTQDVVFDGKTKKVEITFTGVPVFKR